MADGTRQHFAHSGRKKNSARKKLGTTHEVGLHPNDFGKYPVELSGDMRQRGAVARALAVDPDVSFFGEPFRAVDIGFKRVLQDLAIAAAAREHSLARLFSERRVGE